MQESKPSLKCYSSSPVFRISATMNPKGGGALKGNPPRYLDSTLSVFNCNNKRIPPVDYYSSREERRDGDFCSPRYDSGSETRRRGNTVHRRGLVSREYLSAQKVAPPSGSPLVFTRFFLSPLLPSSSSAASTRVRQNSM